MDQWVLRERFLVLLNQLRPKVRENLRETVLPAYAAAAAAWRPVDPAETAEVSLLALPQNAMEEWRRIDSAAYPRTHELGTALLAWAARYHLTDNWLLRTAFATVRWWHEQQQRGVSSIPDAPPVRFLPPDRSGFLPVVWESSGGTQSSFPASDFTFSYRAYLGVWEAQSVPQYRKAARKAFEKALREYLDSIEAEYRNLGLEKSRKMRGDFDRDLVRLIHYQIPPRETFAKIAAEESQKTDESPYISTISRAVERMAGRIGLTLAPR
jgi:hypothetical protein